MSFMPRAASFTKSSEIQRHARWATVAPLIKQKYYILVLASLIEKGKSIIAHLCLSYINIKNQKIKSYIY